MDVNGNCSANGIDITYFVAFLKGLNPSLKWCLDCAPVPPLPAPAVERPNPKVSTIEVQGGTR
jgi:hypothetical protein